MMLCLVMSPWIALFSARNATEAPQTRVGKTQKPDGRSADWPQAQRTPGR
jgi:hypothetical protein